MNLIGLTNIPLNLSFDRAALPMLNYKFGNFSPERDLSHLIDKDFLPSVIPVVSHADFEAETLSRISVILESATGLPIEANTLA
jgi:hypothetical protein